MNSKALTAIAIPILIVGIVSLIFINRFILTVPAGHVAVATLFGKVQDKPFDEGLHVVNPLLNFTKYDVRKKTHKETAQVPSQDQLQTKIDVSIQFRIIGARAPQVLKNTGTAADMVNVHLIPKLRSTLREQGKTIEKAEDFFTERTQDMIQANILTAMTEYLEPKGMEVEAILLRDIQLPPFITRAIEAKKEREQEVEKQKAELERFRTEQQQVIAEAQAQRDAAELEAERRRLIADAQAYEITQLTEAIGENPAYVQVQALEALKQISKDPNSKLYFINGDSPQPLPLMNLGEPMTTTQAGRN